MAIRLIKRIRARMRLEGMIREGYASCDGDIDRCEATLKAKLQNDFGIDPATIIFFVKIAIEIWKLWKAANVSAEGAVLAEIPSKVFDEAFATADKFTIYSLGA